MHKKICLLTVIFIFLCITSFLFICKYIEKGYVIRRYTIHKLISHVLNPYRQAKFVLHPCIHILIEDEWKKKKIVISQLDCHKERSKTPCQMSKHIMFLT